ncbi:permease-like cell division protein FtsX [Pseudoflavonifractor sp. An85]|uniref:permease-like cell division protein FtsX n=1 Tax=Pseudoflavonifractor sp. An85 TaxID=1965661 RepID=UPI000B39EC58|nr:permease-like cell division protein FtsX [Pseudoflavonifractor sp. An85]OUN26009.1 ABC transporter permease [Pseudoflavonifractor sp. An85]
MKRRRLNIGYFVSEGFHSIFSHGLMSFAAVCMIVACLLIMGSFALLATNADKMMGQLEDENVFYAYIDENYTDEQVAALETKVKNLDNVASVEFVTREQAKEEYLAGQTGELYANMPDEVFRDRLVIHVYDLELFSKTVEQVTQLEGVVNYSAEQDLTDAFITIRNVATAVAGVLIAILAAISLFIIANTVRLAAFARREEIAIMKMCGASDGFIRWPFVIEGIILGLFGAVLAFFLQWGIYAGIYEAVMSSSASTIVIPVTFQSIWYWVLGIFALAGAFIGMCGSGFAIRRFLRV